MKVTVHIKDGNKKLQELKQLESLIKQAQKILEWNLIGGIELEMDMPSTEATMVEISFE